MPSPLAHAGAGILFARLWWDANQEHWRRCAVACVILSWLPDFDLIPAVLSGDMHRFHNQWTHSLLMAPVAAILVALMIGALRLGRPEHWCLATLSCYAAHVLMDYLTAGRGVLLFWPISTARFQPPVTIFYGLHWSGGWISGRHALTLANELAFVACLWVVWRVTCRRTPRER